MPTMTAAIGRRGLAALIVLLCLHAPLGAEEVLDQFDDLSGWSALASPGASLEIARDAGHSGTAMRLDFDFHGGAGHVIARKAFALSLPANYAFTFQVRGQAPANTLELKLVDATGDNVWWSVQRDFSFPVDWQQMRIRKGRVQFAWGPAGGGVPKRIGSIEFAITATTGGKGSVWIDDLRFEERGPEGRGDLPPKVAASTSVPGHEPALVLDGDRETSWRSGTVAADQWLLVDFQRRREYGGLVIDWDAEDYASAYQVQVSDDGESWTSAYGSTTGNGGRDYVYMPDAESRYLRLALTQSSRGRGYAIREIQVKPLAFSASLNQFFEGIAREAPPGTYPKYLSGRQTYWTVIGADGDDKEALMNEEGAIEVDRGAFSVEPFLYVGGALRTWNDVRASQELEAGYLPVPSVTWRDERVTLRVRAFAAGPSGRSVLYATYRLENQTDAMQDVVLFLALRPFQVLPPWQALNLVGGVTPIRTLDFDTRTVWVNGERAVVSLTAPGRFGAATFEQGLVSNFLAQGRVPLESRVADAFGHAEGALEYRLGLDPGGHGEVHLAIPFHDPSAVIARAVIDGPGVVEAEHARTVGAWEELLGRVEFRLPPAAVKLERTLKSTLAYILINRDGPALQPGSRTYARSWIRDGAFTSTALLSLGCTPEARDFIVWFAQHQLPDGRIPCCVDRRGVDTVPEHDSNGEFIYTVAEYYRHTRDVGFLHAMWPVIVRAVDWIADMRARRTTEEYRQPGKQAFYGLLPESISHEGYAARPVHAYWDDFFTLRGLRDAASLALVVGDDERGARVAALRDAFRADLSASIARTMAEHGIDYIPASVELADLDPTSTAVAVGVCGEMASLPQPALTRTFERYYASVEERLQRTGTDEGYTPYELRNVEVLVRLGRRERAAWLLETLVADQRPAAWNQWAEIVWRDPTLPRFIGDMPHTWVASSFVRALRCMFACEDDDERELSVAGGLPWRWLESGPGVGVKRLPTHYGVLSYTLAPEGRDVLRMRLSGDLRVPSGRIVVRPPLPRPLRAVTVNGTPVDTFDAESASIREFPADVILEY